MIRQCKKVLKELHKLSSNSEDVLAFLGDTNCICRDDDLSKTFDYTPYKKEIKGIIKQLVKCGYLEYERNEYHFTIANLGLHPCRYKWEDIKSFLFRSVFIPIVVSFITTIIVIVLEHLLQLPQPSLPK